MKSAATTPFTSGVIAATMMPATNNCISTQINSWRISANDETDEEEQPAEL
jgi:hypothetical protein